MVDNNLLFESLFRTQIGSTDEIAYLKQLTSDHPYFSPAQFFLLERTNQEDPGFDQQAARTNILFNNPFWLNLQLMERRTHRTEVDQPASLDAPTERTDLPNKSSEVPQDVKSTSIGEADVEVESTDTTETDNDSNMQVSSAESGGADTGKSSQPGLEEEIAAPENEVETATELTNEPGDALVDDYPETENDSNAPVIETPVSTPPAEAITTEISTPGSGFSQTETEKVSGSLADDEPALDPEEQKELAPLHVKFNISEPTTTEQTLSFEPLHTTDYFASQGIRLSNEIKATDKLGKQLKSFTEWLKTMKKIHAEQPADNINQTDVSIQKLAEKSNDEDEVVTEAMADVLIQQGKGGKAREVYRKLSLLNPSKTAYFAAKIDQLKEQ